MPPEITEASQRAAPVPSRLFGWVMVLCSTLAFSFSPPLATVLIRQGVDPTTMLVARFAITMSVMAVSIAVSTPARFFMPVRSLSVALVAGLINSISLVCFFWSLTRLSTSIASMLFSLYPLALLALLALRGERYTARHIVRLALGLGGAYLLIDPGGSSDMLGVLLVLCTVVVAALQMALVQWFLQADDAWSVAFYNSLGISIGIFAFWTWQGNAWSAPSATGWLLLTVMAVVSTFLARVAMFSAVRIIGSSQLALLIPLETLLSVIWSVVFLGDQLQPLQLAGGALIAISAALAAQRLRRTRWPARWRLWGRV